MKIILTGASSNIGNVLLTHYSSLYDVIPISRTHNWDLSVEAKQQELVELTKTADVLLNVGHLNYFQGILLEKSNAKINISFSSLLTKFNWSIIKNYDSPNYLAEKLFLEHVHNEVKNSALIRISKYGKGGIPSIRNEQLFNAIDDVIEGRSILPTYIDISNGAGALSQVLS